MVKNICFRPEKVFLDRLENYMAIHHLSDKSEAMRRICDEWAKNKSELETLRDYLRTHQPKQTGKSRIELKECPMLGHAFTSLSEQEYFCNLCKKRTPETYANCQTKGGETEQ